MKQKVLGICGKQYTCGFLRFFIHTARQATKGDLEVVSLDSFYYSVPMGVKSKQGITSGMKWLK